MGFWRGQDRGGSGGKAEVGVCHSWGPYGSAGNTAINRNSRFSRQVICYGFTTIALIASQNLRIAIIQLCKYGSKINCVLKIPCPSLRNRKTNIMKSSTSSVLWA